MKRILQIVGGMNRAGAESMLMNLYRKIDRSRFQFDFVYFTDQTCDFDKEIYSLGGRIFRTQYYTNESVSIIRRSLRLRDIIKNKGPFLAVHSHTLFSSCLHLFVAKECNISKRIAHSHNTSDANSSNILGRIYQKLSRRVIKKYATDFIACGIAAGNYLFPDIAPNKINFFPNAIRLPDFANPKNSFLHKELNISLNKFIVIQIGRLCSVKNFQFSIELAAYLKKNDIANYKFIFIGQGDDRADLERAVIEGKLEDYITFLGVRSDIPNLFASADILIMPSIHEGFPVVLVEAQASGLPSVISDNISKEVDMGMELISFCDIKDSFSKWFLEIERMRKKRVENFELIQKNLSEKGFSVENTAKKLECIYEE